MHRVWGPAFGVDLTTTLLWQLAMTPLVYVLSLGLYLLLAKLEVIELEGSHIPWLHWVRTRVGSPTRN